MAARADWYPDPHGGSGVRWWDGDRWTDDVRAEHPRAGASAPGPGPSEGWGRDRLVVSQVRPRTVGGPAYVFHDADGLLLGTMVERPAAAWGHPGERAATLDLYDAAGEEVLRLTRDPPLVAASCARAGWGPIVPWGYVVLRPDLAPVAWVQAPGGTELQMAKQPWSVVCVEAEAPLEIRGFGPTKRRTAPRPVTMGAAPVGHITLVSGARDADAYVLDLFHGPPSGALALTFLALVPLYDQIFRTLRPPARAAGIVSDASAPIG